MTMQLVGPYMTTTRYNRKQKQSKSKKLQKAQAEHEKWLAKIGVGKTKAQHTNEIPDYKTSDTVPLGNNIAGHGPAKESMVYSGERQLLGIATMHKSNMVPVFADRKEDAKDISSMRR
jgi:hypothetical protein